MGDEMHQPRDENGQFVSLTTLFERERQEHKREHERATDQTARAIEKALEAVAETARVHAVAHAQEHASHERIHSVEKEQRDDDKATLNLRLLTMNEIRGALSDLTAQMVTREVFEANVTPLKEFRSRALGAAVVLTLVAGAVGAAIVKVFGG